MDIAMSLTEILYSWNLAWRDAKSRRALGFSFRRSLQTSLLQQLTRRDRRAAVLIGPRQVGKTTLLFQIADDLMDGTADRAAVPPSNITYFDFSDPLLPAAGISPREVVNFEPRGCSVANLVFSCSMRSAEASVGRIG
jgi:hypothetical protein